MGFFLKLIEAAGITPVAGITQEEVARRFEQLPEWEREIMAFRFGLNDGVNRTLEETAEAFKVTRERVRQVEQKCLARLRHPKSPTE